MSYITFSFGGLGDCVKGVSALLVGVESGVVQ